MAKSSANLGMKLNLVNSCLKSDVHERMSKRTAWPAGTRTWREPSTIESGSLLKTTWTVYAKQIFARQGNQTSRPGKNELNIPECLSTGVPLKRRSVRRSNAMLRLVLVARRAKGTKTRIEVIPKDRRMTSRRSQHHPMINE